MGRCRVTSVLFSPHQDDAALFAAYTCIRHDPVVVVVFRSVLQEQRGTGITNALRELEDQCAREALGVSYWSQWPYSDANPDWGAIEAAMRLLDERVRPETVFAPAPEVGGHEQHNQVGDLAEKVFGAARVDWYLTYRRGHGRSHGVSVPFEPDWLRKKAEALACYESQRLEPSTADWFTRDLDLCEYVPAA